MANTAGNVKVGTTGAVYSGATSLTAPTAYNSSLDAGFADFGYITEDGITEARDRTQDVFRAWQLAAVVRTVVTEAGMTFEFAAMEMKKTTVQTFYGATVDDSTGLIIVDPAATGGRKSWVIDIIDGTDTIRWYIAEGEVTDPGDVTYANSEPIAFGMTIQAYGSPKRWQQSLIV